MKPNFNSHSSELTHSTGLPARVSTGSIGHRRGISTGGSGSATTAGFDITPAFLLRVFNQWWKWVVPAGVCLALAAGTLIWCVHVPKYEATALVKIESEVPFIAFENGRPNHGTDSYVQTQIELLRGPVVLERVLSRPAVAATQDVKQEFDPLTDLQEKVSVRQVGKSELYQVSYKSSSAKDAAAVANAIVEEYLLMQDREEQDRAQVVINVLEKERKDRRSQLTHLRRMWSSWPNRLLEGIRLDRVR